MRVCIFGAGAIGGLLAHGLAKVDGIELSVMARGAHLEAMLDKGIALVTAEETTVSPIAKGSANPADLGEQDVVFNCLKSHQAWQSAEAMGPLLDAETTVVTCQNGVPWWYFYKIGGEFEGRRLDAVDRDNRQWDLVGPQRAIGCSVYPASEITAPGVIKHVYGDKFALGEPNGTSSERVIAISQMLETAGFKAPVLDDIRSEVWLKLWGNLCFNPISALTRATLDVVATDPGSQAVAKSMMLEAQVVAEKLGASFRVDVDRRIGGAAKVGAHRTSMLQDLEAGKAMEIDALVTAVQEMGLITGIATPMLDAVLALVQQLGSTQGLYPTYPQY